MIKGKILPFVYLALSFSGILLFLSFGVSQVIAFYKTGADPSDMLLLATADINDQYQPRFSWSDDGEAKGRPMEKGTLSKISRDFLASEYFQQQALLTGNTLGLHDYFTEKSRDHMIELTAYYNQTDQKLRSTGIEHHLSLKFYSEDGTVVVFEDRAISYHQLWQSETIRKKKFDTSSYQVMMLLEDNYWRVRHKVMEAESSHKTERISTETIPRFNIEGTHIMRDGKPFLIRGMNYYPRDYPWNEMWENFEKIDFHSDFDLIQLLGFNSIRIFVPFRPFGGAKPDRQNMDRLRRLMDIAHEKDLNVIVTLYDFFLGYQIEEWTLSDRHLEEIVMSVTDHPALLAWDLKNEPDLDFERHGQETVIDWLRFILNRIRYYDPHNLVTIGWSQPEFANILKTKLDFLSFHFYRDPQELVTYMNQNKDLSKPLFLGETGMTTFDSWWYPFGKSYEDQSDYYRQISDIIKEYNLNYGFWTLYDFSNVPGNVAGRWPWQRKPQSSFGILNHRSKPKESIDIIKELNYNIR